MAACMRSKDVDFQTCIAVSHRRWLHGVLLYILSCHKALCNFATFCNKVLLPDEMHRCCGLIPTPIPFHEASGVQQDSEHPANSTWKPWLMSHGPTCREGVENKIIHSQLAALARIPVCDRENRPLLGLDQPHFDHLKLGEYAFTLWAGVLCSGRAFQKAVQSPYTVVASLTKPTQGLQSKHFTITECNAKSNLN